jgi:signal transduction histidine kinase
MKTDPSAIPKIASLPIDVYGDPLKIRRIFNQFILVILAGLCIGIVYDLYSDRLPAAIILGVCTLPVLASRVLIHRGRFEMTAILLAIVLISMITVVATKGQGIRHIIVMAYPPVLIVASLVVRKRIMVFLTLYSIACAAWLFFGAAYGLFTAHLPQPAVLEDFVIVAVILIATAFMVRLLTEAMFQNSLRVLDELNERKRVEAEREELVKKLEAQNAEMERFNYTVSHDLKTPLVTIKGFLGYLEQDVKTGNVERIQKDSQRIANAVDNMNHLLSDLLELSRVGRIVNEAVNVPFTVIVQDALDIVQGQLEARGVTVQTQPNLPIVHGDRQRLTEVLQNLLDNAVKYLGDQPNPRIEIGRNGEQNGKPIFFVKDNGMGIAPEYHERIFGLFNKLDAASEGTGVGLAIVKRIIEFHGGRIWVESEAGMGSTFYFTLPTK